MREYGRNRGRHSSNSYGDDKKKFKIGIIAIITLVLLILFMARIEKYEFIGNTRYTDEEMREMFFPEYRDGNSIYAFIKNKFAKKKNIAFIQDYEINWKSPLEVQVIIYEKNIVGYISYMSSNMYFDKDGIIVESTDRKLPGIPMVSGLEFGSIVLYRKIPVENTKVFNEVMNLTGSLAKYGIDCDEIIYNQFLEAALVISDIKVLLGSDENMEMKISLLKDMISELDGLKGELDLSTYSRNNERESYIFKEKT